MKVLHFLISIKKFLVCEESFKFLLILKCYYEMNDTSGFSETSRSVLCCVAT